MNKEKIVPGPFETESGCMNAAKIEEVFGMSRRRVSDIFKQYIIKTHKSKDEFSFEVGKTRFYSKKWIEENIAPLYLRRTFQDKFDFQFTNDTKDSCMSKDDNIKNSIISRDSWIRTRQLEIIGFLRSHNRNEIVDEYLVELKELIHAT